MLSDPEHYQDVILWKCVLVPLSCELRDVGLTRTHARSHAGDAFFVAHNDRFINEVLPNAFGHSNVHSFTRASLFRSSPCRTRRHADLASLPAGQLNVSLPTLSSPTRARRSSVFIALRV